MMKMISEAINGLMSILEEATRTEDSVSYVNIEDAETLKKAILALKKQMPMEPVNKQFAVVTEITGNCPACACAVSYLYNYCPTCGQRLLW